MFGIHRWYSGPVTDLPAATRETTPPQSDVAPGRVRGERERRDGLPSDLGDALSAGRLVWEVVGLLILAGVSLRLALTVYRGEWQLLRSQPGILIIPGAVLLAVAAWRYHARHQRTRNE